MEPTRAKRFEELFRESYPLVSAYALRRTAPDLAQDVVAETFLVAWRRLEDVPQDALPWLYGTARRVLANQRRSASRRDALKQRLADATAPTFSPDPADGVADAELLMIAVGRLPDRSREALMLDAWECLDGGRAARAAGCSRAAFALRLHRARAQVGAELAALDAPPALNAKPTSRRSSYETQA